MLLQKKYAILFLLVATAFGLYCFNPFQLYFLNDDFIHIPLSANGQLLQHNSFRPVCDISIMLDYYLWGTNAYGWHITNLLLHIINTALVFILSKKLCNKYFTVHFPLAFFTALLFFLYAMHSEAVFWILGRSASLGFLFSISSVIFFLKRNKAIYYVPAILFAIIAWLSYESAWILIFIFATISFADVNMQTTNRTAEIKINVAIIIFFIAYLFARNYFINEVIGQYGTNAFLNFNIETLGINFLKLALRSWLPPSENKILLICAFVLTCLILVAFLITAKEKNKKITFVVLIILWLVSLIPYASLSVDTKGTESERFLYMPSFFVCCIIIFIASCISLRWLRNLFLSFFFLLNMFFLWNSSSDYQFASTVSKTAMEEVQTIEQHDILLIDALPQEYHGALIFRKGFTEGVKWMNNKIDSVIILSVQQTDQRYTKNYRAENILPVVSENNKLIHTANNNNFVYLKFADSALQVYRH